MAAAARDANGNCYWWLAGTDWIIVWDLNGYYKITNTSSPDWSWFKQGDQSTPYGLYLPAIGEGVEGVAEVVDCLPTTTTTTAAPTTTTTAGGPPDPTTTTGVPIK